MISRRTGALLLAVLALSLIFAGAFLPSIPQPQAYHHFADTRSDHPLANTWNVLSNIPFALVGLWGLFLLFSPGKVLFFKPKEKWLWTAVSIGLILTALGSAYYHLAPDNDRLVIDRLPMGLVFMSFISALIFDRVCSFLGWTLWPLLVGIGVFSVFYWHSTEEAGNGDLRFYLGIQAFTLLGTLILMATPSHYTRTSDLFLILLFYCLAVLFEAFDTQIFHLTGGLVSGHTLKHLSAAFAGFWMFWMIRNRTISPVVEK